VVAGTIPIDMLAAERRTGSTGSRTQRSNTIEAWQKRWNNATTGRWTHRLIPNLTPWMQWLPVVGERQQQQRRNRAESPSKDPDVQQTVRIM